MKKYFYVIIVSLIIGFGFGYGLRMYQTYIPQDVLESQRYEKGWYREKIETYIPYYEIEGK